jgi:hypothetical protein
MEPTVSTWRRVVVLTGRGVLAFGVLLFLLLALFFVLGWISARHLPTPEEWGLVWASLRQLAAFPQASTGIALYMRVLCFAPAAGALVTAVVVTLLGLDRRDPALARRLTMWGAVAASLYVIQVWTFFATVQSFVRTSGRATVVAGGAVLASVVARRILLGPRRRERLAEGHSA